jgi:hypothetical protein
LSSGIIVGGLVVGDGVVFGGVVGACVDGAGVVGTRVEGGRVVVGGRVVTGEPLGAFVEGIEFGTVTPGVPMVVEAAGVFVGIVVTEGPCELIGT